MNLNDENIDKIFRDAASNSQSPDFKEDYWSEMQAILAQENNTKKTGVFDIAWIALAITALTAMLAILFLNPISERNIDLALSSEENEIIQSNENTESDVQTEEKLIEDKEFNLTVENNDLNIDNNKVFRDNEKVAEQKSTKTPVKNRTDFESKSVFSKEAEDDQADAVQSNKIESSISRGMINENEEEDSKINEASYQNLNRDVTHGEEQDSPSIIAGLSPKLVQLANLDKAEQELAVFNQRRVRPEHGFSLDFGLSFAEPYQGNTSSSNRFSLGAMYNLDYNNIILRTGMGITVERSSNLSVREESMVYSYTATKYENVLDYKMFTELYIPLEIGYRFNNTTFGAGAQLNVLLGTRMSHIEKINDEVINDRILNNRTEGLNSITGGAYLWIQQHLNTRLMAGVRIGRNIGSRIEDSNYLHDVSRPTPIFGQIYVSYQLFRK